MIGAQIRGVQSQHIISTLKPYALNAQETGRMTVDARIDENTARISDYLAVQIALERSRPGAVMCAYNKVNGTQSCEHAGLLTDMLRQQWGWPFDDARYFGAPLSQAIAAGQVSQQRLDDMARRIVRAMLFADVVEGITLLKNGRNILPLAASARSIAVIGGQALQGLFPCR